MYEVKQRDCYGQLKIKNLTVLIKFEHRVKSFYKIFQLVKLTNWVVKLGHKS